MSIDDALVAENMTTKENVVVMDNGCVCCTVRGDLIRALAELHKKGPFDSVLLETTGLADPSPVALSFFKSAVVNMNFKLDAIVCLVDAKHIMQHLTEVKAENAVNEAVQQVAFSDKIIVNKKDLVSPEELEDVVRATHPFSGVPALASRPVPCPGSRSSLLTAPWSSWIGWQHEGRQLICTDPHHGAVEGGPQRGLGAQHLFDRAFSRDGPVARRYNVR